MHQSHDVATPKSLRVCCVQLSPVHGDILASQQRADALLATLSESVHVVLLPELAFVGYLFSSKESVLPLAERCGEGPTAKWARELARARRCLVCVGYVERAEDNKLYNSQALFGEDGAVVANHRKKHLYEADECWAEEGRSWTSVFSASLSMTVFMGIW